MNFLSDSEWLQLIKIIEIVNSVDDDRKFRTSILEELRVLIPYDSAAFFLADLSKADSSTESFLTSPIGIDVPKGKLDEYIESAWEEDDLLDTYLSDSRSTVIRESDFIDSPESSSYHREFMDNLYVVTCLFDCDRGPLGSINLNRLPEHGDFSSRDVFILKTLEPHITNRLKRYGLATEHQASSKELFYERNNITNRERDIIECLLQGMNNDLISKTLCISPGTTKKHLENIFKKTDTNTRLALILKLKQPAQESLH